MENTGGDAEHGEGEGEVEGEKKVFHTYPLVVYTDMSEEMQGEAVEVVTIACEKYPSNLDLAARHIKQVMDVKYGASWHVAVGESFGFDVPYETNHMLFMYFGGNMGIALWKCA
ncbi:dynein light chain 4, axonemal-like [Teleopsis dalmanni]|uniref:dynein light chain 4, axonemal-like n=1 Tax=Teleopsis dalmanni TaxID=139649 RepID=UPI0018CD6A76|nr:dynein light chain 4, axonemal-like [Teleopsis dalmanni]XP_037954866.1 dynein light chain 4, axonemal-like [Teleopsis dalmanni]